MSTKCGSYNTAQSPSNESKEILIKSFTNISELHSKLNFLTLEHLLENHTYSTQVVAGLNYKFHFEFNNNEVVVVVWKKLDNTLEVSLKEFKELNSQNK